MLNIEVLEHMKHVGDEGLKLLAEIKLEEESEYEMILEINRIEKCGETFVVEIFLRNVWMDFIAVPSDEFLGEDLSQFFEVLDWEFMFEGSNAPMGTKLYLKRLSDDKGCE